MSMNVGGKTRGWMVRTFGEYKLPIGTEHKISQETLVQIWVAESCAPQIEEIHFFSSPCFIMDELRVGTVSIQELTPVL